MLSNVFFLFLFIPVCNPFSCRCQVLWVPFSCITAARFYKCRAFCFVWQAPCHIADIVFIQESQPLFCFSFIKSTISRSITDIPPQSGRSTLHGGTGGAACWLPGNAWRFQSRWWRWGWACVGFLHQEDADWQWNNSLISSIIFSKFSKFNFFPL